MPAESLAQFRTLPPTPRALCNPLLRVCNGCPRLERAGIGPHPALTTGMDSRIARRLIELGLAPAPYCVPPSRMSAFRALAPHFELVIALTCLTIGACA